MICASPLYTVHLLFSHYVKLISHKKAIIASWAAQHIPSATHTDALMEYTNKGL